MPKIYPAITRMLAVTMFVTGAFADTVTLKSGEHLEGKITKETDKDITIEVKVSAGVIDEKVVPKADIEKIDKTSPEVVAYQAIVPIQLGQNSLSAAQYDPAIRALQAFVTQYPTSVRTADVQTTLNAFQDEKKRVEAGEVKINGEWISKVQADKEKVQINGRLAYNYMMSQNTAGDHVGALNTFAALEKTYPGAAVMPDAIDLAQKLIVVLKTEVEQAIPGQKAYKENLEKGFAAANPADRAEMMAAFKKEQEAGDAVVVAADSAGRWVPFNKNNAKCLASLKARALKEEGRLAKLDTEKMRQSLQLTDTARQSLASGDAEAASKTLREATKLWAANELANRLTKDADAELKAATTTPAPTAPTPKQVATPKPKATPRPSGAAPAAASAGPARKDEGEDRPFYMTLPGAIGIVASLAVVLAGANIFVKMKKRKAEQAE